jgi:hypothetical protein
VNDLELDKNYKKGSKGRKVKLIQEWLCLHGFHVAIDSDFGPATDSAIREFQKKNGLKSDGVVGKNTFARLIKPMTDALKPIAAGGKSLGKMVVAYAEQHLKQAPLEIGGQNRGPWVRLYMDGNEGPEWPWCAGFASFILKQACRTLDVALPIETSVSCDVLAGQAKQKEIFVSEPKAKDRNLVMPGSLFLVRRTDTDWIHTGIVLTADSDVFYTIEGNTNDDGGREGYEVCKRIRGYQNKDFIVI